LYWQSEQTAKRDKWIILNGQELANVTGNISGYHLTTRFQRRRTKRRPLEPIVG
jgi:hypothetical protein